MNGALSLRLQAGIGCLLCSRATVAAGEVMCSRCLAEWAPTPLRTWRLALAVPLKEIVETSGLTKRSVLRADAGDRMSHDAARALERATGMHWRTFRPKKGKP